MYFHFHTLGPAYLGADVVKGRRADDRETDEEHIRLGVGERSQSVVILLSSGIPQTQANWFAIHHNTGRIVVEPTTISATAMRLGVYSTYTVGIYSPGNALVV